jgi:hypothetical protein
MANLTLKVIMLWVLLGLLWASLHDTVTVVLPSAFTTPIAENPGTWGIMVWIWDFLPILIGLNLGVSAYKSEGRILGTTKNSIILLIAVTAIMLLWLSTYDFTFHSMPTTLTNLHIQTAPSYLLTMYNSAMVFLIIGLVAIMFIAAL